MRTLQPSSDTQSVNSNAKTPESRDHEKDYVHVPVNHLEFERQRLLKPIIRRKN
ncbi:MAG: hypothetical protein H8E09_00575 [Gammaproteobacteria bacterium]|jgi:hypothetical protein|nr:hypothetical protein [Gammaproteobacteria bacterium]